LTKATLLALRIPSHACCSCASEHVQNSCNSLVHNPAFEAELRSVRNVSLRPKRKIRLTCNGCAGGKQFQSLLAVMELESKVANVNSARLDSTQNCKWHAYEFSDLCVTCFLSLVRLFNAELKPQVCWNYLHHSCCHCYWELTSNYSLEELHELKSASFDVLELLKWRDGQVHTPHGNLYGSSNLGARAPLATECTKSTAGTTHARIAEDIVGGIVNKGITTFTTATTKTTATLNSGILSGALLQAEAVQPATSIGIGVVPSLWSVDEQYSFQMQSEVLKLSHEYLEMPGLVESWCFQALQCAMGTKSGKEVRTGTTATNTADPQDGARTVVTQASIERSTMKTTSTSMQFACATALVPTQHWHKLRSYFLQVTLHLVVVFFIRFENYLVYC